ncbi:LysR family transcriptional regulator substrate-binding protein [Corynebacterium alimapuense]|uniref:LysR family transcriptional regulator n=1 Tax=Corynebacterium alimapuense TaxID=1576874 RepID=A0A3M8K6L2_9CORY|nr:LysR family transcriptional regulator substrate-binding protein [Corynebacterium alimapuense]RNE48519.1 LysR family transcriptional regulator [Corynebacterium alimapuense]
MLSFSFATGTEPGKWFARFQERTRHGKLLAENSDDPLSALIDDRCSLALVRLPDERVDERFHVVELYEESLGVALPKDHELTLLETLGEDDIAEEIINYRMPAGEFVDVEAVRAGLQVVAANVGVLIAPRPLIKVLSRKQIAHRDFRADNAGRTQIALVWHQEDDSAAIQDFVGIAKGRTANSSRQVAPKRSAREKALAKQQRRAEKAAEHGAKPGSKKGSGGKRGSQPRRRSR